MKRHQLSVSKTTFIKFGIFAEDRHRLSHQDKKDHVCDLTGCTAAYATKSDLQRHQRSVLELAFATAQSITNNRHSTHSGKETHLCDVGRCGRTFSRSDNLYRHKRSACELPSEFVWLTHASREAHPAADASVLGVAPDLTTNHVNAMPHQKA